MLIQTHWKMVFYTINVLFKYLWICGFILAFAVVSSSLRHPMNASPANATVVKMHMIKITFIAPRGVLHCFPRSRPPTIGPKAHPNAPITPARNTKILRCPLAFYMLQFRGFSRIFGHLWDQCKSEEKPKSLGGRYLRKYLAYRSDSHIKICRIRSGIVCQSFQNCRSVTYSFNLRETWPISSCFWPAIAWRAEFQPLFRMCVSLPDVHDF